jgi:hypothetical protein
MSASNEPGVLLTLGTANQFVGQYSGKLSRKYKIIIINHICIYTL